MGAHKKWEPTNRFHHAQLTPLVGLHAPFRRAPARGQQKAGLLIQGDPMT